MTIQLCILWFAAGYLGHAIVRLIRDIREENAHEEQKYQSLIRACEEARPK